MHFLSTADAVLLMDPLTAFAAAGNVLQFVQLAATTVDKFVKYVQNGGDLEHQRLQAIVQQLLVSNDHLRQSLEAEVTSSVPPGPRRALYHANQQCLEISREFVEFLDETKLTRSKNPWKISESLFATVALLRG